jgi:hypothetical protein
MHTRDRDRERKIPRVATRSIGRLADHPLRNKHINTVQYRSPALVLLAGWVGRPQARASARGLLFGGMPAKPARRSRAAADPKGVFDARAARAHGWGGKSGATRGFKTRRKLIELMEQKRYRAAETISSCRNDIRWSYHRTRCERAAVCLCVLVVCLSRDCPPFVDHLGLAFAVLLAMHTRSCTGMGSNRAARSARYLLSACALVVSHATAFLS